MKNFLKNRWVWLIYFLIPIKASATSKIPPLSIAPISPTNRPPEFYAIAPMPPDVYGIAMMPTPTRIQVLVELLPVFIVFSSIITTIVGIIWYLKNKTTRHWFQFFISKTFYITILILILICNLVYWFLIYMLHAR